ncbi:MAG: electron transport complex subunit RsxE [Treponema sp.]|uniref:electron transport complex subunit RsxE n=1 Tax=Treponema sp. TaxID=166 RepID=UPI001B551A2A|nr:electron transport complex subunit RsxE [Treponema sp.]MBP5588045.1 electron transport complex subunit RsxE [Treponema sp.]MCR5386724.1 electron transport complex subunit RsxE [Treponema sp.]
MKNYFKILTNGILRENPLLVLSIGLCSSLAVTTSVFSGLGMGLSMTFVLLMSEIIISIFRKHIPDAIRLPIFIIIIAAFTTIVQLLLNAYLPSLSDSLGVFLPLIVVNCIIMGRVESFASKNNPFAASLDAIGMGLGYTWVLATISFFRELLGSGKILGHTVFAKQYAVAFFSEAPGGFFIFGLLVALSVTIQKISQAKKEADLKKDGGNK